MTRNVLDVWLLLAAVFALIPLSSVDLGEENEIDFYGDENIR